ncbi:angiogenic factor with G patch and FHA domains 1 isoform X2 [Astyanax mexicanus]|uniref:angiogenic factor with G patch and FHA domains 1 isoform X2 n=1 Tax=Astyanax mexicanus TaxID=7994 RepID=UPI0020CB6057|nr:angiogenic factor with G patch and FHA domains 1 isoform X2 [Astyanax mexicanus]
MASDAEEICTSDPVDQEMQESSKSTEESVEAEKTNGGHIESLALNEEEKEEEKEKEGEESVHESVCPQTAEPVSDISCQQDDESGCEVAVLQKEVERLQRELKECQSELQKVQKQLSHSVRLQKSTESYNQDLRQQVEKLSVELHERKKKEKNRVEAETQTEEYTWTETDYYNYYYGGYYQSTTEGTAEADPTVSTDTQETTEQPDSCPMATEMTAVSEQPSEEMSVVTGAEVTEAGGEGSSSIADMLRATAEEALNQTGFVFDENSGMYYDHATGFYYDSTNQLYYDANTGMYYYYDTESGKYQFHSRIELPTAQPTDQPVQTSSGSQEKISKKKSKRTTEKPARLDNKVEAITNSLAKLKIARCSRRPAHREAWPPCVRVTVVRSPVLQPGTLFILTADAAATIGREKDMNHAIRIPEMGVSKSHAEVFFDQDQQCYMLVDQGSQNGTVINGNRILQPKVRCDPCALTHGDEVKLGETVLSFHIHSGTDTCDGCEPGQVRAHLNRHRQEESTVCVLSKEEKEVQRQKELKQIKIKYGLKSSEYEESGVIRNSKYKDRAETRRQTVGSEGTFFRDDAPASLHVAINEENKGRQMLEKMGWKSGEGLGKDGAGITEPIGLQMRQAQSGLGSTAALTMEEASAGKSKKQQNWERARERFSQTEPKASTPKPPQTWVKGQPAD